MEGGAQHGANEAGGPSPQPWRESSFLMGTDNSIAAAAAGGGPGYAYALQPFDLNRTAPLEPSKGRLTWSIEAIWLQSRRSERLRDLVHFSSGLCATARAMSSAAADAGVYEEIPRVVVACAARIGWRLRPQSKRRLLNDILFLCTGLRSVVLIDYGGIMPQLKENLSSLLHHAQQESSIFKLLKVMIIKDMLYLIHVKGLAECASPIARSQHQLAFVDLEKSCCKLLSNTEENDNVVELVSIQDLFSAKFPVDTSVNLPVVRSGIPKQQSESPERTTSVECTDIHDDKGALLVDLSTYFDTTQVSLVSINGWLLGYPVTYLFCNESADAAIQNLSNHSLHIYRVYVCRSCQSGAKQSEEELMCFSVPCEMSTKRGEEPWAKSFVARMNEKIRPCKEVWLSMRLQIEFFQSQSQVIVL